MGSKTRLSSYCTKRGNNTVNLATSRKINTRLARPIDTDAFSLSRPLCMILWLTYLPGPCLCQDTFCGWPTYPVLVFVMIHFVVDLLTRSLSLSGYILWLTYLPGPCLCQDTFCGWPNYPVLVFVRIHFVVDLLTRSLPLSGYILWLTYLPGPCLCQDTFCGWPTYLVLVFVRIDFVVDLLTRSLSLSG